MKHKQSPLYIPQRRSLILPPVRASILRKAARADRLHAMPRLWVVLVLWVPLLWLGIMAVAWVVFATLNAIRN